MKALIYIVPVALAIFALIELARSVPEERAGIRRLVWVAIIVLLPVLGPLVWIFVSRYYGRTATVRQRPTFPTPPRPTLRRPRPGPVAPDDDPDFLWRLEQERKRAKGGGDPDGGAAPNSGS